MTSVQETNPAIPQQHVVSPGNDVDIETDAQPALNSNIISEPKATSYDCNENQQQPQGVQLIDVAIVYAKNDFDMAVEFIEWLKSLLNPNESDARIYLFDDDMFGPDKVQIVENVVSRSMFAFMFLTKEFNDNLELHFFNSEAIGQTRLAEGEDLRRFYFAKLKKDKYAVRPVHTKKQSCRNYKTPSGLHSLRSIDYYDKDSSHTIKKTRGLLIDAIKKRQKQEGNLHLDNRECGFGDNQGASAAEQRSMSSQQNKTYFNTGFLHSSTDGKSISLEQNNCNQMQINEAMPQANHQFALNSSNVKERLDQGQSSQNVNFSVSDSGYTSVNATPGNNSEPLSAGQLPLNSNVGEQSLSNVVTTRYSESGSERSSPSSSLNNFSNTESQNPVCMPERENNSCSSSQGYSYHGSESDPISSNNHIRSSPNNTQAECSADTGSDINTQNASSSSGNVEPEVKENTVYTCGEGHSKNERVMATGGYNDYPFPPPQRPNQTHRPVHTPVPPISPRLTQGTMPRQAVPSHGQGTLPPYPCGDLLSNDSWQEDGGSLPIRQPSPNPPPSYVEGGQPYPPHTPRYYEGVDRITHIHYHYNEPRENHRLTRENTEQMAPPAATQYNITGCNVVQIGSRNAVHQSDNAGQINDQVIVVPSTGSDRRSTSQNGTSNEEDDAENDDDNDDDDDDDDDDDETSRQKAGESWNDLSQDQYPSNSLPHQSALTEQMPDMQVVSGEQEVTGEEGGSDEDNESNGNDSQARKHEETSHKHTVREQNKMESDKDEASDEDRNTAGKQQQAESQPVREKQVTKENLEFEDYHKTNDGLSEFLDEHLNDTETLDLPPTMHTDLQLNADRNLKATSSEEKDGASYQIPVSKTLSIERPSSCEQTISTSNIEGMPTNSARTSVNHTAHNQKSSSVPEQTTTSEGPINHKSSIVPEQTTTASEGPINQNTSTYSEQTTTSEGQINQKESTVSEQTTTSEGRINQMASTVSELTTAASEGTLNQKASAVPELNTTGSVETPVHHMVQTLTTETILETTSRLNFAESNRTQGGNTGNSSQPMLQQFGALFQVQRQYIPGGRVQREIRTCLPCPSEKTKNDIHEQDDDDLD